MVGSTKPLQRIYLRPEDSLVASCQTCSHLATEAVKAKGVPQDAFQPGGRHQSEASERQRGSPDCIGCLTYRTYCTGIDCVPVRLSFRIVFGMIGSVLIVSHGSLDPLMTRPVTC